MFNLRSFLGLDYYTSELDQFLKAYDEKHPRSSASQLREIDKYRRIARLRDQNYTESPELLFWDKF